MKDHHISRRHVIRAGVAGLAAAATVRSVPSAHARQRATPAADPSDVAAAIDTFAHSALETYDVPGGAVSVVQNGEITLEQGYGVLEAGTESPVDLDTIFQLASVTKPLTSFTMATQVDEGLLDWDTPVREYLPELEMMDSYVTINGTPRDYLTHSSGLPGFYGDLLGRLGYDRDEVLRKMRYITPASTFREVSAYSNLGFFVMGEIIDRLAGMRWEDVMQERVFDQLGMTRSGPAIAEIPDDENVSANHAMRSGSIVTVPQDTAGVLGAAASAYSSAHDMGVWMQALLQGGGGIVQPERIEEMFAPSMIGELSFTEAPPIDEHAGFSYGLGWGNYHFNGYEIIEKGGALDGIRSIVVLVPELGFGITALANLNLTFFPEAVRAFALEQVVGAAESDPQPGILDIQETVNQIFASAPGVPDDPAPASLDLDAYTGTYHQELRGGFDVILDGDALRIEAGPIGRPASLEHFGYDSFLLDWGTVTSIPELLTFTIGADGLADSFSTESYGQFDRVDS